MQSEASASGICLRCDCQPHGAAEIPTEAFLRERGYRDEDFTGPASYTAHEWWGTHPAYYVAHQGAKEERTK